MASPYALSWPQHGPRTMFIEEIRHAIPAVPREKLPDVLKALWAAFAAGQVTEAEAEELSGLIEARKTVGASPAASRRAAGSRPRSSGSLERRRRWAASGHIPGNIACRFTTGEAAVLAVIALEASKRGDCRWTIGHLAAVAGVSDTTVKRAIREAKAQGLISVEERRLSAWRNDSNVLRIVSPEWVAWGRLGRGVRGGGGQLVPGTNNNDSSKGWKKGFRRKETVRDASSTGSRAVVQLKESTSSGSKPHR